MGLYDFAFCPRADFERKIANLAGLCPEKWSFGTNSDNVILKNYILHTFQKLEEEGKISETETYAILDTGLFTKSYQSIYAYFVPNKNPERQKWFLDAFNTQYQMLNLGVSQFPGRANYFADPSALVFDVNCDIIPQYDHIFDDPENFQRLPESIRNSSTRQSQFDGALKQAKNMICANYKTAIPQYYKGRIQLLIPICLLEENHPDLALVVGKHDNGNVYMGHTCLTLDMAYNNARLIARPDSNWLHP